VSIVEVSRTADIPVIASGGIRNGVDIVKSLALGASLTSLSYPILKSAVKGFKETRKTFQLLINELQTAMFLLGTNTVTAIKETPIIITGRTAEWLNLRGFNVEEYAQRERN
jgi:isopentenyl-diphosphate delta-isomerase